MRKIELFTLSLIVLFCFTTAGCDKNGGSGTPDAAVKIDTGSVATTSRDIPQNADVFGLELGYANKKGVVEKLGAKIKLKPVGGKVKGGHDSIIAEGEDVKNIGLDRLKSALFSFDDKGILINVELFLVFDTDNSFAILTGDANTIKSVNQTYQAFTAKYKKTRISKDTLGRIEYAQFTKGGSSVYLNTKNSSMPGQSYNIYYRMKSAEDAMDKAAEQKIKDADKKSKEQLNKL